MYVICFISIFVEHEYFFDFNHPVHDHFVFNQHVCFDKQAMKCGPHNCCQW